jgi:hypothetical protein
MMPETTEIAENLKHNLPDVEVPDEVSEEALRRVKMPKKLAYHQLPEDHPYLDERHPINRRAREAVELLASGGSFEG